MRALCFILALVKFLIEADAARLRAQARGLFTQYTAVWGPPKCDCNCCIVQARRPGEGGGAVKCGVPPPNDERNVIYGCPSACSIVNDAILGNSFVLDVERFCFYHCKVAGGAAPKAKNDNEGSQAAWFNGGSITDTPCMEMSAGELKMAATIDGNARDAAIPPPAVA